MNCRYLEDCTMTNKKAMDYCIAFNMLKGEQGSPLLITMLLVCIQIERVTELVWCHTYFFFEYGVEVCL